MKRINIARRVAMALLLSCSAAPALPAESPETAGLPVERYALYVSSNDGGPDRETLKYAYTDATRLARTLGEIGGIRGENSLILSNPSPREINDAFADMASLVRKNAGRAKRTEFLFYYSGHSDEKAFLLGSNRYPYAELKTAIDRVPSDVHVVMLDSCYSGNFVRAKGGSRQRPFLVDDSTVVQGHAYLSSSSGFESSQESDMIQASYFTHALVTGLRGAADASGDNKVSLNELYHYAFNETLSSTELSSAGPQHPSYDITLVGSGDLILTDLSNAESVLHIGSAYQGHFFIRDASGQLVSELNKTGGTEIALALPAGTYAITIVNPASTTQGTVTVAKGERLSLSGQSFVPVARSAVRTRGDADGFSAESGVTDEPIEWTTFSISGWPGFAYPANAKNVNFALGVLWSSQDNIGGLQANLIGGTIRDDLQGVQASYVVNYLEGNMRGVQITYGLNIAKGEYATGLQSASVLNYSRGFLKGGQLVGIANVAKAGFHGIQAAGIVNSARDESKGIQLAGITNVASEVHGAQVAGIVNVAKSVHGAQIGLINVARECDGAAIGLLNFIGNGIMQPGVYVDSNGAAFFQYQGGTERFFTTLLVGTKIADPDFVETGWGFGTRLPITKKLSCDIEILSKRLHRDGDDDKEYDIDSERDFREAVNDSGKGHIPSLRMTTQYAFARHFSAFCAVEAEMLFEGYNDEAFTDYGASRPRLEIVRGGFSIYPNCSLGLKF